MKIAWFENRVVGEIGGKMTVFDRGEETTFGWLSGSSKIQQLKNRDSTVFLCRGKVLITRKICRTNGVMNYPGCKRFYISFF